MSNGDEPHTIDWSEFGLVRTTPSRLHEAAARSIPEIIAAAQVKWPDAEALVSRHGRYTYAQLAAAVDRAASALWAEGVRPGARVAASSGNHTDIVVAFFAVQRIGAIWVGVNRALAAPEKLRIIEDCEAQLYLADKDVALQIRSLVGDRGALRIVEMEPGDPVSEWARLLEAASDGVCPAPAVDPFAPAGIAYTSGTTGKPKGVVHSQHNMLLVGAMGVLSGDARAALRRAGVALPLTILNLMILGPLATAQSGAACILMDRIDTAGLTAWIREERIETFAAVPTMIYDLLTSPEVDPRDLSSLKAPGVGGAAMPPNFRALYQRRFGQALQNSYGLTEAPTTVTVSRSSGAHVDGASGTANAHLRVTIQDEAGRILPAGNSGEICVSATQDGPFAGLYTPMLGYWRQPDATQAALRGGFLHTGDIGRLDAGGNLFVEGRRNDVILRGGANIYPAEIEKVLQGDNRVAECAVTGQADERLGERVVAFVLCAANVTADEALRQALEDHCLQNLARYKCPEVWVFVDKFPRNAMNKIVKAELSKQLR